LPLWSMRYQRRRPVTRSGWSLDSACYGPQVGRCSRPLVGHSHRA
jgi:hypothetical protein